MKSGLALAVCALLFVAASGDCYMFNPRGSNNKLNDENNTTQNEQRLFDSQNNANAGHHWGPPLKYYVGSELYIEWTNQHACGDNGKVWCEIVLQYMCEDTLRDGNAAAGANGRQTYDPNQGDQAGGNADRGRHETGQWYLDCLARERNKGLFTADQGMQDNIGATSTRQDTGGTQHGTECPEERDYYPYWHPTPWKDVAILATNVSRCEYYQLESGNVMDKGICDDAQYNNQGDCQDNGGTWTTGGSHGLAAPECHVSPWSRDNANSNGNQHGAFTHKNITMIPDIWKANENCVLRIRYNISTGDSADGLAFWDLDYKYNGGNSPVQGNPEVDLGLGAKLKLALNTDQYGRTFEDRSHTFEVAASPPELANGKIFNLNVRGRRGNIVQAYPCVEYDYVPNHLHVGIGDYVHIQWTGSNYNAADQAGEGTDQTDRHNLCQLKDNDIMKNYPANKADVTMFDDPDLIEGLALLGQANNKLNDAPEMYDAGLVRFNDQAIHNFMCTRNNNFTNRSQKGSIIVGAEGLLSGASGVAVALGLAMVGIAVAAAGMAFYARSNPQSAVGQVFARSGSSYGGSSYGSGSYGSRMTQGTGRTRGSGGSHGSRNSKQSKKSAGAMTQASGYTRAQR